MGRALYRSYRARNFNDVIGQSHITDTLRNSIKSGKYSHAYLLTGPRGVGKTSVARIIAHEVNELSYDNEEPPIDIIEIDAASNRRIDEIRDIKEKAFIAPVQAKHKVYIVDEVHMLTKESFNALLKILEEPPAHVIFILATTEFHKLPQTIVSRCMHFPFKPIEHQNIVSHLSNIAKQENINIDNKALELIAAHGKGSFRDSISILDQIRSYGNEISLNDVRSALGLAPEENIRDIYSAIETSDIKKLFSTLDEIYTHGAEASVLSGQLQSHIRDKFIDNTPGINPQESVDLMQKLLLVSSAKEPKKQLEIVLMDTALKQNPKKNSSEPKNNAKEEKPAKKVRATSVSEDTKQSVKATQTTGDDIWQSVLNELKTNNSTLYGIARMASCEINSESIILKFKFAFHLKQMSQTKNLDKIKQVIHLVTNKEYNLSLEKDENITPEAPTKNDDQSDYQSIRNIFHGSEVLES